MTGETATAADPVQALIIAARTNFAAYVSAVHRPRFHHSYFSLETCRAVDQFVEDVIAGKRPVLDLTAPPQHGKSSLTSRCLPGYLIGRLGPVLGQCRIALSSYALARAKANARDAKSIMLEPIYREIFPHASLIGFKGVNTADEIHHPFGFIKAQGAGGSLTGFSIDCFAPDTLVTTDHGPVRIDQLHLEAKTTKVLCFDGTELRYASIKAIAHREAARLYRINTVGGRVLSVTGNHPIYSAGTYRPAAELSPGDVLLCAVPADADADRSKLYETGGAVPVGAPVLQSPLFCRRSALRAFFFGLHRLCAIGRRLRAQALPGMRHCAPSSKDRSLTRRPGDNLPAVWRAFRSALATRKNAILRRALRIGSACRPDAWRGKSKLAEPGITLQSPSTSAQPGNLPVRSAGCVAAGSINVPTVCGDRLLGRSSHRPQPAEQCMVQFTDLVSGLSHAPPSRAADARIAEDRVRSVEIVDGPVRVYDVQVQTHANLFAGGILAHNCAINDDLTKDAQEALSETVQNGLEDWYDSVLSTRLQERSGQVNIGTPWSAHDIMARIHKKHKDSPTYRRLSFVALNLPDQVGYNPEQPEGPLVPKLHSLQKLQEIMRTLSEMWWAAMFQQAPMSEVGAIFKKDGVRYYRRADLPRQFVQTVISVDATFKDKKGSDYVFAGVWGKTADERVYLLDFRREKLSFTKTAEAIVALKGAYPSVSKIFIEDAANGPALIDMLSKHVTGIVGVPPLGSKEARAHAVSWVWANGCVMLPHPDEVPGIKPIEAEITAFPDVRNDDAVDGMTIALHQLCLRNPISAMITADILRMAGGRP